MDWITAHTGEIISIVTGTVAVASVVAKITPNETDDKLVGFFLKLIDLFALSTKPTEIKR